MTLYEFIMAQNLLAFTKKDWSDLGKGDISDDKVIQEMLAEGYGAIANAD